MNLGKKAMAVSKRKKKKKRDDQTDEDTNEIVLPTLINLSLTN